MGEGPSGGTWGCWTQVIDTVTTGQGGVPSLLKLEYWTRTTYTLIDSMGGYTAHFLEGLDMNRRKAENMAIHLTEPIRNVIERLHLEPLPPQCQPPRPMRLKLGKYNI